MKSEMPWGSALSRSRARRHLRWQESLSSMAPRPFDKASRWRNSHFLTSSNIGAYIVFIT
jgi:hypothetical protein